MMRTALELLYYRPLHAVNVFSYPGSLVGPRKGCIQMPRIAPLSSKNPSRNL